MSESADVGDKPDGPEIALVRYSDGVLTVSWTASVNPSTTFEVYVCDGGTTVARVSSGGASTLSFPLDVVPGRRYEVTVGQGPGGNPVYSARVPIVTTAPQLTVVEVGSDRSVSLSWTTPSSPDLTNVQPVVRWDGTEITLDLLKPTPNGVVVKLPAGVPNTATIALRALAGLATGPTGGGVPLLTTAPTGLSVSYDGTDLHASWDALPSPLVSGYRVGLVANGTTTALGDTLTTAGVWPVELADPTAAVVVRALTALASGAPSAPVPVFAEALVIGASYLAPQLGPVLTPRDIVLGLPELFAPPPPVLPGNLPLGITLTRLQSGPYVYQLTIPANSPVWQFTSRTVIGDWSTLLTTLEASGLTSYGAAALTEAVSRAMPQTFAETLYFAYGLQFDQGCFDLRPGLVVRVEYESYQTMIPGPATAGASERAAGQDPLSGFVTTGIADYEVASYRRSGRWMNGLDAFLTALTEKGVTVPIPTEPLSGLYGGGGVLDAFTQNMQLPYVRLVYPTAVEDTTSVGSIQPERNAVLLAAGKLADLEKATKAFRAGQPMQKVAVAYFRGRAAVRALLRISVNGRTRLVPAGTTLGNVLAEEGRRPPAVPLPLNGVTLRRARAAAARLAGPADDWKVVPGWGPYQPTALDLPLLHGDRLELRAGDGR